MHLSVHCIRFGVFNGAVISGALSDKIGRKKILCLSAIFQFIFALAGAYISNYALYCFSLFVYGFFGSGGAYVTVKKIIVLCTITYLSLVMQDQNVLIFNIFYFFLQGFVLSECAKMLNHFCYDLNFSCKIIQDWIMILCVNSLQT